MCRLHRTSPDELDVLNDGEYLLNPCMDAGSISSVSMSSNPVDLLLSPSHVGPADMKAPASSSLVPAVDPGFSLSRVYQGERAQVEKQLNILQLMDHSIPSSGVRGQPMSHMAHASSIWEPTSPLPKALQKAKPTIDKLHVPTKPLQWNNNPFADQQWNIQYTQGQTNNPYAALYVDIYLFMDN